MSPEAAQQGDWVEDRIHELRYDRGYQAKVERIRQAVAEGSFEGTVTTRDDLERLRSEI